MLKVLRVLFNLIVISIFILIAGVFYLRVGLPRVNGTFLFSGLNNSVEIIRDQHGIPHIYAATDNDAFFALGFVHAQDRLWQMEFQRRLGAGRLSEFIGERTLELDKFFRTLSIYYYAKASFQNLNLESQNALKAYTNGINAYLENRRGHLPPEFLVFRHKPEPWQPADSLVWIKMMAWDLSKNWEAEILRARLTQKLSAQEINQFFPPYPKKSTIVLPDFQLYKDLPLNEFEENAPKPLPPGGGSNAWVVSGEKTATGKPLLAADPHLNFQSPSLWYFAHIKTPNFETIGATLPGLPAVIFGHNNFVAWGFTNLPSDNQDLFIERLAEEKGFYLTPTGQEPFSVRREIIKVKNQASVILQVRESRHGPIISDIYRKNLNSVLQETNKNSNRDFDHVMAFSWPVLSADDLTLQAGLKSLTTKNITEFTLSLKDYHSPHLNMLYADINGGIGYYAPARVPVRVNSNGLLPVEGWSGQYDWQGFIPFEELPNTTNPVSGQIVSANHKIVPDEYPYFLSADWAAPYRAERIEQLLKQTDKHTPESFARIQADQISLMGREFLPLLLENIPQNSKKQLENQAFTQLRQWDGNMSPELAEPLIFYTWYKIFTRLIYADDLEELFEDTWGFRPLFLRNVVNVQEQWCDDTNTPVIKESCEIMARRAWQEALLELTKNYGKDISKWRWGKVHIVKHDHVIFSKTSLPLLRYLFELNKTNGGDSFTINVGHFNLNQGFTQTHGPTLRVIYDLANLDNSRFIHTTGQSGHPLSLNYRNFINRWQKVTYISMNRVRPVIEEGKLGKLILKPIMPPISSP